MPPPLTLSSVALACCLLPLAAQSPALLETHLVLPPDHLVGPLAVRGDVDGDGRGDVVWLRSDRANRVWLGAGDAHFVDRDGAFPPDFFLPRAAALADLDGDGDLDCVTADIPTLTDSHGPTCTGGADRLYLNDGTGRFTRDTVRLPSDDAAISTCVQCGDVDGDGDPDLVFGTRPHVFQSFVFPFPTTSVRGENWLFLNDGSGTFVAANSQLPPHLDATNALLLRDWDGDSDLDLWVGNAGQDRLYRNNGAGVFSELPGALPPDTDEPIAAHALDFDGDGRRDVLVYGQSAVRLLHANGNGTFADASAGLAAVPAGGTVIVGDWDGDGDVDLGTLDGARVQQWRNNGAGVFTHAPAEDRPALGAAPLALDADADGDLDLLLGAASVWHHRLLLNDGSGSWHQVANELPDQGNNEISLAVADLDADGDLDVVTGNADSGANSCYRNDGTGRFTQVAAGDFTADRDETMGIAVGDVDGDGDPDIACANSPFGSGRASQLYRNDGTGMFTRQPIPTVDALDVAFGDLDGDGDLDLYFGTLTTDQVLLNQGGGVFTALPLAVTVNTPTRRLALVDVDGDGDRDAVLACWFGRSNRLLRNDGTGRFTDTLGAMPTVLGDYQDVAAIDVDNDGDQDLVFATDGGGAPEPNRLFLNNGLGIFTDASQRLPPDPGRTIGIGALDVDGDGDQDLVEATFYSPGPGASSSPSRLLLNDGTGTFTVQPTGLPLVTGYAHDFAAGDFDGDGDLDAFLVTQGPAHVYWNARRQLAWRTLPRVGRPLTLDLYGRAAEPLLLGVALQTGNVNVPGFGVLRLDLANAQVVMVGAFDAAGRAALTTPVPNVPAFVGLVLHWQALCGTPLRFGNLETTTLSRR